MKGKEEVHKSCLSRDFIRNIILGRKCMLMHDWSKSGCELKCGVLTEKNPTSFTSAGKSRNWGIQDPCQKCRGLSLSSVSRWSPLPCYTDTYGNGALALRGTKYFSCVVEGVCSKHKQRTLLGVQKSAMYPYLNLLITSSY